MVYFFGGLVKKSLLNLFKVASLDETLNCQFDDTSYTAKRKGGFDSIWLPQFPPSSASLNTVESALHPNRNLILQNISKCHWRMLC